MRQKRKDDLYKTDVRNNKSVDSKANTNTELNRFLLTLCLKQVQLGF